MGSPITPGYTLKSKKFSCKPERLTSGLLHVLVKHEVQDQDNDLDTGEKDVNHAYIFHWNTGTSPTSPNAVPTDGDFPFHDYDSSQIYPHADTEGHKPDYATDFAVGRATTYSNIPTYNGSDLTNVTNTTVQKNLSLGDYDCFIFHVTCANHLESNYWPSNTVKTSYSGATYYSSPQSHNRCQSFIKSHLISRINNIRNTEHTTDYENSMTKQGVPIMRLTADETNIGSGYVTETLAAGGDLTCTQDMAGLYNEYLISNGVYEDPGYGLDLETKNTFFTPVYKIAISTDHSQGDPTRVRTGTTNPQAADHSGNYADWQADHWFSTRSHSTSAFNLTVDVYLWAYNTASPGSAGTGNSLSYTKNRVNVMWQPFGETADLGIES